jgi:hypothetical protein
MIKLYDVIDAWGERLVLEFESKEATEDWIDRYYWENGYMDEAKQDLPYTIVKYSIDDDGEQKDIKLISGYVEYEETKTPYEEHNINHLLV